MEGGCVEMKKEYISPEVEMTKFEEIEDIMTNPSTQIGVLPMPDGSNWE